MSTAIASTANGSIIEKVVAGGDLASLTPAERMSYYAAVCDSVGLNPLTQPFGYIKLNGKLTLYALKACTDQLRKIHHVSVSSIDGKTMQGLYVVTCKVQNKEGRTDVSTGAVSIGNLQGDALGNAIMKAETKAKRRATLSICGLGILDETEADAMPGAKTLPAEANIEIGNNSQGLPTDQADMKIVSEWTAKLNPDVMNLAKINALLPDIKATTHAPTRLAVWEIVKAFAENNNCTWDDNSKQFVSTVQDDPLAVELGDAAE